MSQGGGSSLAASGGTLYWTSFTSIGTTLYGASLFAGSAEALLLGGSGTPLEGNNPYAGLVRIAQGLRTAAIVGPAGVTFIDASGALVFIEIDDLGYVGFGHPAP